MRKLIMRAGEDYFVYLPESRLCSGWGCTALSTGFTRIPPGSAYPPVRHPDDHHFVWERGRTLQAYQFALISQGRGRLQAAPHRDRVREVEVGDVILLYPGVWHRFAPDPTTGWTENWIECRGSAFDHARSMGLLPIDNPLWAAGRRAQRIFPMIHRLAREDALANQPTLSTLGLTLLAELCQSQRLPETGRSRIVERARRRLMEQGSASIPLEELAREIGVSYPTLRRLFRQRAGVSLKQYQTDIRMRRARELLRYSERSVKEIAALLGYGSAFHFSAQFRKASGSAPSHWRRRLTKADEGTSET